MALEGLMNYRRLEKSLLLRVEERLGQLLPEAKVHSTRTSIRIKWDEFEGGVDVKALTNACLNEERQNWGAIAGGFCNLVAARVHAWFSAPLEASNALEHVFPAIEAVDPGEDAIIREAAPDPELLIIEVDWLDGLRIEYDYRGPAGSRRLLQRDLRTLGLTSDELAARADQNLAKAAESVPLLPVGTSGSANHILCAEVDGTGPGLLTGRGGHAALFDALAKTGRTAERLLACAPRSDLIYFCDSADKAAASEMVALAWRAFEAEDSQSVPLSPRLFSVIESGDIRYIDVGLTPERVPDWTVESIGPVAFAVPPGWRIDLQDNRYVLWTSSTGPRVRVRMVPSGGGSPKAAQELAERVRNRHGIPVHIGHGFFNGLPWAWVDTGVHSECATASMFVVVDAGLVILQTEVPSDSTAAEQAALQRAIATIHKPLG
jgi:hypothetical protein